MPPSSSQRRVPGEQLLFVTAIAASAFLIFLVQPMVAKRMLPWFGGAPGVWTLCLAFYQTSLFLGYAYAHLLIRFISPAAQLALHAIAVLLAILVLPVLPGDGWQPHEVSNPSVRILATLAANVALPFIVLASTGPLLQAWFARRHPHRSPYPLYAISNAGSLAALLAYPFLIEPRWALSRTGDLWSLAFAGTASAVLACAALAWRTRTPEASDARAEGRGRLVPLHAALWLLLSACAVVLLMGVTNKLCVDIASVPFLWVLPLATYLITFVICFASEAGYRRAPYVGLAALALVPSVGLGVWVEWLGPAVQLALRSAPGQIASYCLLLFSVCMILHGELYRLRPTARSLTGFYLCVSAGGALGGIFVGVAAPFFFEDYYELPAGLALAGLLLLGCCESDPERAVHSLPPSRRWAAAGACALLILGYAGWSRTRRNLPIHQERSFFGVYRVFEDIRGTDIHRRLRHGTTLHGVQMHGRWRRLPTSYYGRATGVGLVLGRDKHEPGTRIGVIGLGIGTLATYAGAGDSIRFYEIDPVVVRLARDDRLFHFLEDSAAEVEIVPGDGRLALAAEQSRGVTQAFDYLIVDAFNSDAVPVHLLTVEAFEHYVAALAPDGLLAIHASNNYFDLMSLVTRIGAELGLHGFHVVNARAPRYHSIMSEWVWLSRDRERVVKLAERLRRRHQQLGLDREALQLRLTQPADVADVPVWTDDYSDLFGLLKRQGAEGSISNKSVR